MLPHDWWLLEFGGIGQMLWANHFLEEPSGASDYGCRGSQPSPIVDIIVQSPFDLFKPSAPENEWVI